jgi:hypothetical protein
MCTLLIFPCLPKVSTPVLLAGLAEPPTTDKECQALETLQCQYRGVIGNSFGTGLHAIHTCFHAVHAIQHCHSLSPPLSVMALYLRSPGFSAKSMMLLSPYLYIRICANLDAIHRSPCWLRCLQNSCKLWLARCAPCRSSLVCRQ